jgi:predicted DNA-binding transcriptional regulator YafY
MRYEKAETVFRIALDMQGSALGLTLHDLQHRYSDKPLSRRTAERLRSAVERLFPGRMEVANRGETPKRWRLPPGTLNAFASPTAEELADLNTAVELLRRHNMQAQADGAERAIAKLRALMTRKTAVKIEPDLEVLTEAEGLAMRPGPKPKINQEILCSLRQAIITQRKVRLHYLYRTTRRRGYQTVHPYGFLYGNRHYLVAWSELERAKDFRSFALSNIERVQLLDQGFDRDETFSIGGYAENSFGVFQEKPVDVVWKFRPDVAHDAQEFMFHPGQKTELLADGSFLVSFRAGGLREMCWHLFTWGDGVEVVKPRRLAAMLRDLSAVYAASSLEEPSESAVLTDGRSI